MNTLALLVSGAAERLLTRGNASLPLLELPVGSGFFPTRGATFPTDSPRRAGPQLTCGRPRYTVRRTVPTSVVERLGRDQNKHTVRRERASEPLGGQCGAPGVTGVHSRSMGMTWSRSAYV